MDQAKKKSTKTNFRVRTAFGGVGVFHVEGWVKKVWYVPLSLCLSLSLSLSISLSLSLALSLISPLSLYISISLISPLSLFDVVSLSLSL